MRRFALRSSTAWARCFSVVASTALVAVSCTNDFAGLYAEQGSSGGSSVSGSGGGAPSVSTSSSASSSSGGGMTPVPTCEAGDLPTGEAAKPPSSHFPSVLCASPSGCKNTMGQTSTLSCNACEAECNDFTCSQGGDCDIWCSQKTTCQNETCNGANTCKLFCQSCNAQLLGSASDVNVSCSSGSTCDIALESGTQNTVIVNCTSAQCKILVQAQNLNGACSQGSTCDISCKGSQCILGLSCDAQSKCIYHCKPGVSCPQPPCTGTTTQCGPEVWACNTACPG